MPAAKKTAKKTVTKAVAKKTATKAAAKKTSKPAPRPPEKYKGLGDKKVVARKGFIMKTSGKKVSQTAAISGRGRKG